MDNGKKLKRSLHIGILGLFFAVFYTTTVNATENLGNSTFSTFSGEASVEERCKKAKEAHGNFMNTMHGVFDKIFSFIEEGELKTKLQKIFENEKLNNTASNSVNRGATMEHIFKEALLIGGNKTFSNFAECDNNINESNADLYLVVNDNYCELEVNGKSVQFTSKNGLFLACENKEEAFKYATKFGCSVMAAKKAPKAKIASYKDLEKKFRQMCKAILDEIHKNGYYKNQFEETFNTYRESYEQWNKAVTFIDPVCYSSLKSNQNNVQNIEDGEMIFSDVEKLSLADYLKIEFLSSLVLGFKDCFDVFMGCMVAGLNGIDYFYKNDQICPMVGILNFDGMKINLTPLSDNITPLEIIID